MAATTTNARIDRDEAVARAAALVPTLAERALAAERLRRLPDETVADLRRSGLLRILQPARYGGHELDIHAHLDVVSTLAQGCASTAWCAGVIHAHTWLSALFDKAAQDELYGADPDAITCAVVAPRGTATREGEGYRLSGFWPFGSGCQHSQWMFLGAQVKDASGAVIDEGEFLVPTQELTVNDDWHVAGLKATGSCSVQGKDLFVPARRFLSTPAAFAAKAPGMALHTGWLYRAAAVPVLDIALTGPALGIARGALAAFLGHVKGGRILAYTGIVQKDWPVTHAELADAAIRIDMAELLLRRLADDIEATARAGAEMPIERRARARMDCAQAVRSCLEAVEILFLAAGGGTLAESHPLQRASRDVHAINMHGFLALRTNQEVYGRALVGLPPNTPLI